VIITVKVVFKVVNVRDSDKKTIKKFEDNDSESEKEND
jgi:hypothetical protein